MARIEYEIDVDVNYKSVEDLKKELGKLEAEFETVSVGSKRFNELGNQIKGVKSQLKDIDLQFEGLDKEQRATALVDTFNGLSGAVGAVSSAFIAFGANSENIENAEKKILGVIGVVSGLRDVSNGLVAANKLIGPSFTQLGSTISTAFTSGSKAAQAFKISLASLGIGLLIIALDQLIQNWDKVTAALGLAEDKQKKYNDALTEAEASVQGQIYDLNFYNNIVQDVTRSEDERLVALNALNEAGVTTEDINLTNAESLDELNDRVRTNIELIVAQTKAEAARQLLGDALKKQLEVENSTLEDNISFWEKAGNQILYGTSVLGQYGVQIANATTASKNQAKEQAKANEEVARATKVYEDTLNKLIPLQTADAETKKKVRTELERKAQTDKAAAKALEDYDKKLAALNALEEQVANDRVLRTASERDRIRLEIEQQYADRIQLLVENGRQETETYKELLAQRDAEVKAAQDVFDAEAIQKADEIEKAKNEARLTAIDEGYANEIEMVKALASLRYTEEMSVGEQAAEARRVQQELDILEAQSYYDRLIEIARQNGADTTQLEAAKAAAVQQIKDQAINEDVEKQKAYRQQLADLAIDAAGSLIGTLKDLNSIYDKNSEKAAKKAFERQKALNIVETIISTYSAAQKAYASQFVPIPDPSSPIRGGIAAGLAVASGLAKLAIIKSQKFNSTGSGGSASGATGGGGGGGGAASIVTAPSVGTVAGGIFGGLVTPPQTGGTGGAPATGTPGSTEPLRAYVLAGDVTNAQEANAKINNVRKL